MEYTVEDLVNMIFLERESFGIDRVTRQMFFMLGNRLGPRTRNERMKMRK